MRSEIRPALVLFLALTLVTGVAYPGLVTAVAGLLFPRQAVGSLVARGGRVVGSALIGQSFHSPAYFRPRPSATARFPYNALASGGSNRGPLDPALVAEVRTRAAQARAAGAGGAIVGDNEPIPVDLVTASASGLDPHVSVPSALLQADAVARSRGLPAAEVRRLVARCTEGRTFGLLGEPRVNVLQLNLALDDSGPATGGRTRPGRLSSEGLGKPGPARRP